MKRKIYIETSVISYLTARPSNDSIKTACQQITRLWWDAGRVAVSAFISPYVVEEASAGDPQAAKERIDALLTIPVLPTAPEIIELAEFLLLGGGLPPKVLVLTPCTSPARAIMKSTYCSLGIVRISPIRQSCR